MNTTIERQCEDCKGTGLYVGFAEKDGAAVVCSTCDGTGRELLVIKVTPFTGRKERLNVKRVFRCNPGIGLGPSEEFGGLSYVDWKTGKPFPQGSEMRGYFCPAWYYQCADFDKKPDWPQCGLGAFADCKHFKKKQKCWERWDMEYTDGYRA